MLVIAVVGDEVGVGVAGGGFVDDANFGGRDGNFEIVSDGGIACDVDEFVNDFGVAAVVLGVILGFVHKEITDLLTGLGLATLTDYYCMVFVVGVYSTGVYGLCCYY